MNDKPDSKHKCCGHDHKESSTLSKIVMGVFVGVAAVVLISDLIRIFGKATGTVLVLP